MHRKIFFDFEILGVYIWTTGLVSKRYQDEL